MPLVLNHEAVSHARSLIAAGKVDHGPWDGESAPRNAQTCLACDTDEKGKKGEFKYPVVANGHVNVKGVASAAGYATTEGAHAIASVAHRLSDEIHQKSHASIAASADSPFILSASALNPAKAVPLSLAGHPDKINGQPIHYFKKELARSGNWVMRANGTPFTLSADRFDKWIGNYRKRRDNGIKPFVPGQHRAVFNATDNHGFVVDLERQGESLVGTLQLVGDDAAALAAKNDVSIYVTADLDAQGNQYDEVLHHVALTPNPNQPHLSPFVKIAASADGGERDVPVFELSATPSTTAAPSRRRFRMKPENAQQVRAKLGLGADVPDDQLDDRAAERALSLSADVERLNGHVATLTTERDTAKQEVNAKTTELAAKEQEVLALSADKKEPDSLSLGLISKAFRTEREQVIAAGTISEAGMQELDKLFYDGGKPTRAALALSAGSVEPLYSRICEILRKFPGIRTGGQRPANATPATPLKLDAQPEEKAELSKVNDLRKQAHLPPLQSLSA